MLTWGKKKKKKGVSDSSLYMVRLPLCSAEGGGQIRAMVEVSKTKTLTS